MCASSSNARGVDKFFFFFSVHTNSGKLGAEVLGVHELTRKKKASKIHSSQPSFAVGRIYASKKFNQSNMRQT